MSGNRARAVVAGRRQQQPPDLHAVERSPAHRLQARRARARAAAGFTVVSVRCPPLARSSTTSSPIVRASTDAIGQRAAVAAEAQVVVDRGALVRRRSARPLASDTRTIGISNICAPRGERALVHRDEQRLAVGGPDDLGHPRAVHRERRGSRDGSPPAAGATASPRGAMMPAPPLVDDERDVTAVGRELRLHVHARRDRRSAARRPAGRRRRHRCAWRTGARKPDVGDEA